MKTKVIFQCDQKNSFRENVGVELNNSFISNYRSDKYKCRVAGSIIMYLFVCVDFYNP